MYNMCKEWQEKCWGQVIHVFQSEEVAVSVLQVKKGFRCSRHLHQFRLNQFNIISGKIEVWEWENENDIQRNPNNPMTRYNLHSGQSVRVRAKRPHLFRVLEDGIIVEIYSIDLGPVDINDIVRFDEGGEDDLF